MLVTAITQSIRSLLITLIPSGIVTFLAWAIAGSAYASTTDPFRAAAWITLGAHAIPFNLHIPPSGVEGWLTYLPLGAMALPVFAIGIGARRTLDRESSDSAVWLFAFTYTLLLSLLALVSSNFDVSIRWYWALAFGAPFVLAISVLATNKFRFSQPLIYVVKIWAILLGLSALILGLSLFINLATVKQLTTVLQPGWIGGVLLLALTILYIPNFLIATISYLVGAGFGIGRGTEISPLHFQLGKIPALPILGALPTGKHPLYLLFVIVVVLIGALVAYWTLDRGNLITRQTIALFVVSTFVIAYLGSGALITYELGEVGPSLWKFPLIISLEFLIGVGLIRVIPLLGRGK